MNTNWLNVKIQHSRASSTSKLDNRSFDETGLITYLQEYLQTCPVTLELLNTEGHLTKIMHFLTTTAIPELNLAINLSDFPSNLKSLLFNIFQEIPRIHHASKTVLNIVKSPKFLLSNFQDKETQISQILRIYREFMIRQTELYELLHTNSEQTGLFNIDDLFLSSKITARACKNIKSSKSWLSKEFISFDSMLMRIVQRPIQLKSLLQRYVTFSNGLIRKKHILEEFVPGLQVQLKLLEDELLHVQWVIHTFDRNSMAKPVEFRVNTNLSAKSNQIKTPNPKNNPSSNKSSNYDKKLPEIPQRIQSLQTASRYQTPNQTRRSPQNFNRPENPQFQFQLFPTFIPDSSSPNQSLNISRSSSSATNSSEDSTSPICKQLPRVSTIPETDDELTSDSNSTENLRMMSHRFFEPMHLRNSSGSRIEMNSPELREFKSEPRRRKPVIIKWKSNDDLLVDKRD